jgi:hypothetical protein
MLGYCSVEKSSECHFERAEGESRNLFLSRFLHFAPVLSAKAEMDASVETTVRLFNRALGYQSSRLSFRGYQVNLTFL